METAALEDLLYVIEQYKGNLRKRLAQDPGHEPKDVLHDLFTSFTAVQRGNRAALAVLKTQRENISKLEPPDTDLLGILNCMVEAGEHYCPKKHPHKDS